MNVACTAADMDAWRLAAFVALAFSQTIFIILWGQTRWWIGYTGKAFYFKSTALALLADTIVASVFFDWPHEETTKTAIYWVVAAGATAQLVAFMARRKQIRQEAAEASYGKEHTADA